MLVKQLNIVIWILLVVVAVLMGLKVYQTEGCFKMVGKTIPITEKTGVTGEVIGYKNKSPGVCALDVRWHTARGMEVIMTTEYTLPNGDTP